MILSILGGLFFKFTNLGAVIYHNISHYHDQNYNIRAFSLIKDKNMTQGFITLHRKMIEWEWFTDINTTHLFLYCLLRANHENKKWRGIEIERGSFITSLEHTSKDTGLTVRQVRTALDKLKSTGELTSQSTSQYSIISIKNYNLYQDYDKQIDKRMTSERQTNDKRATTNNNDNNDNNDNNIVIGAEKKFKIPTVEEIKSYCIERNNNVDAERFYNYYQSKGWMIGKNKMKDWKAAIRTWERKNELTILNSSASEGGYNCGF